MTTKKTTPNNAADSPTWTDQMFAEAKLGKDVFSGAQLTAFKKMRGQRGPQKTPTKQQITLRLDPAIVAHFKNQTPNNRGWQALLNKTLLRLIQTP